MDGSMIAARAAAARALPRCPSRPSTRCPDNLRAANSDSVSASYRESSRDAWPCQRLKASCLCRSEPSGTPVRDSCPQVQVMAAADNLMLRLSDCGRKSEGIGQNRQGVKITRTRPQTQRTIETRTAQPLLYLPLSARPQRSYGMQPMRCGGCSMTTSAAAA